TEQVVNITQQAMTRFRSLGQAFLAAGLSSFRATGSHLPEALSQVRQYPASRGERAVSEGKAIAVRGEGGKILYFDKASLIRQLPKELRDKNPDLLMVLLIPLNAHVTLSALTRGLELAKNRSSTEWASALNSYERSIKDIENLQAEFEGKIDNMLGK